MILPFLIFFVLVEVFMPSLRSDIIFIIESDFNKLSSSLQSFALL